MEHIALVPKLAIKLRIRTLLSVLFGFGPVLGFCQSATLLINVSAHSEISLDGEIIGEVESDGVGSFTITAGEHILQAKSNGEIRTEIFEVVEGQRKIFQFTFGNMNKNDARLEPQLQIQPVATHDFYITGSIEVVAWMVENPDQEFPDYPKFHYAFQGGDKMVLDYQLTSKKGTILLEVTDYPEGNVIYSNYDFQNLDSIVIDIPATSIYRLDFGTEHGFNRTGKLTVRRIPGPDSDPSFRSQVRSITRLDTIYETGRDTILNAVQVVEPTEFYLNSTTNISVGRTRVIQPVTLPPNTVEWFYTISATRNEATAERYRTQANLFGQIIELLTRTSGLGLAVDMLTQPPGEDYCNVYLLDANNHNPFASGDMENTRYLIQGSRENVKGGVVKVTCCLNGMWYLGIQNEDSWEGINVIVEAVALVKELSPAFSTKIKTVKEVVEYEMME